MRLTSGIFLSLMTTAITIVVGAFITLAPWTTFASAQPLCTRFGQAEELAAFVDTQINESSGIAVSRDHADIFWTHNDSGDGPRLFAVNSSGASMGEARIVGADARDWEDMALGPCDDGTCLFVGDIGDNQASRSEIVIWRVTEPDPPGEGKSLDVHGASVVVTYPGGPRDAEGLAVDPLSRDIFIVEKSWRTRAAVYRLPNDSWNAVQTSVELTLVDEVELPGESLSGALVTGADIDPTGSEIYVRTYGSGFRIPLVRGQQGVVTGLGDPQIAPTYDVGQCESAAYAGDGLALWFTCEDVAGVIARSTCVEQRSPDVAPAARSGAVSGCGCGTSPAAESMLLAGLVYLWGVCRMRSR